MEDTVRMECGSGMLSLIVADDTVQYDGKDMPSGTMACAALNTEQETLDAAMPLCQRITRVNILLRTGNADRAVLASAGMTAHELLPLIGRCEPFAYLTHPELTERLDRIFSMDAFRKVNGYEAGMPHEGASVVSEL